MRRIGTGLLYAIGGYVVAGVAAYFLVLRFSGNVHDRDLEAAMTSAFFVAPVAAVVAFVVGAMRGGRCAGRADGGG
jgi:hypothetical protein